MFTELEVCKMHPAAKLPERAHPGDAGLDLYNLEQVVLARGEGRAIRTGIAVAIPHGYMGLVADRSSLGKRGIKTAGGVIDAGYRGEIHVILWNLTSETIVLKPEDRIGQLLIVPIALPRTREVPSLDQTSRGEKGFGSTGR